MIKRAITQTLGTLGLVALLTGCNFEKNTNRDLHFKGYIDGDHIHFYEEKDGQRNILRTKTRDGHEVTYFDNNGDDLKIDGIGVSDGRKHSSEYINGRSVTQQIKDGQKEFDNYLAKIKKERSKPRKLF